MSGVERWRRIPGFPDYEVSDQGRVRSYRNNRWGVTDRPHLLSLRIKDKPESITTYREVRLIDAEGRYRTPMVHQVVLLAFVGPRPDGMVTRHLNGEGSDNRLENLRYGTPSENGFDDVAHGKNRWALRTHCNHGHEFAGENLMFRSDGRGRACRTCRQISEQRRKWKRQGAA